MHENELQDIQALVSIFFPIAEELLGKYRELQPFAGATTHAGEFVSVGSHYGNEKHDDEKLIQGLKQSIRERIEAYLVAAVFFDVRTKDSKTGALTDAIAVYVEHRDGSTAYEFFYPYKFDETGIRFDESYGNPLSKELFG